MFHTRPQASCFADDKSNMLRTLLHLAGKIKGSGENKIRIGLPEIDLGVKPLDVDLGRGQCLLSGRHSLAQLRQFCCAS